MNDSAYRFYRERKRKVRKPLMEDYLFKKFKQFIEWRKKRGDMIGYT